MGNILFPKAQAPEPVPVLGASMAGELRKGPGGHVGLPQAEDRCEAPTQLSRLCRGSHCEYSTISDP